MNELSTSTNAAKLQMRDILDCNGDTHTGHNEWLWEIFDKLCEYDAFLPNIYEDMNIKKGMLEAERDRCMGRSKSCFCFLVISTISLIRTPYNFNFFVIRTKSKSKSLKKLL